MTGKIQIAVITLFLAVAVSPSGATAVEKPDPLRGFDVGILAAAKKTDRHRADRACRLKCRKQYREKKYQCELYRNRQDHNDMNKQSAGIAFGRCMGKVRKFNKRCEKPCGGTPQPSLKNFR